MKMTTWKIVSVIIGLTTYSGAIACKCGGPGTIAESFKAADGIIRGVVVAATTVSFSETVSDDMREWVVGKVKSERKDYLSNKSTIKRLTIKLVDTYKGIITSDTVDIYTGESNCEFDFEVGKEYLVYGYVRNKSLLSNLLTDVDQLRPIEKPNSFWTNRCTRTTEYVGEEGKELKKLRGR